MLKQNKAYGKLWQSMNSLIRVNHSQTALRYHSSNGSICKTDVEQIQEATPEHKNPIGHYPENEINTVQSEPYIKPNSGQKLQPENDHFLVLDPQQTGILKKRSIPTYFKQNQQKRLSILQGMEINPSFSAKGSNAKKNSATAKKFSSDDLLRAIEHQRKNLLEFESLVSNDQLQKAIHDMKPISSALKMSQKRYEQLKNSLEIAYTLPQLKQYCKRYNSYKTSRLSKKKLIQKIMDEFWECQIDESVNELDDLILEQVMDVTQRDMYLLLLTDNGKILQNLARIGATIAAVLAENKIIVRGTRPMIRYVEVSIANILNNISSQYVSMQDFIEEHSEIDKNKTSCQFTPQQIIELVQKEGSSYFEEVSDENGKDIFLLSALGEKRVATSKKLLLWALDYKPQVTQDVIFCGSQDKNMLCYAKYPVSNTDWFDWISKKENWFRLQRIRPKNPVDASSTEPRQLVLSDDTVNKVHLFCIEEKANNVSPITNNAAESKSVSVTLGQILTNEHDSKQLFQAQIPQTSTKILKLPLYDGLASPDELFNVDQHQYFIQLKFIPELSALNFKHNIPPLELWFALNDEDGVEKDSIRCINHLEERSMILQAPELYHDFKITMDHVSEMVPLEREEKMNWIEEHQPGLKEYLDKMRLDLNSKYQSRNQVLPEELSLNIKLENGENTYAKYRYLTMNYRRVLNLKYMDKHLVQFSNVNGGNLGGTFSQIEFIGGELLDYHKFSSFIKDVTRFH
ncbi:Sls1p Ecym_4226 [Eremothecium cymbalariae DBVPG|uniref:Uncharacterized protein n=1 Tax=Eremothecium cymbalariae (strain CBS 270.75 / DBVPG 7215 / KCTC 17166 / NRRL Y-17582) TaxID=931890 RepID=G8JTE0_ERECY|nr:hypothetical protein Ecym_4226 [Eremothecium cymbalariae DBVPG\